MNIERFKETKYLYFEQREDPLKPNLKTRVYHVQNKASEDTIGYIKWYFGWRQYVFFPKDNTLYNYACLQDIADFLIYLKEERKENKSKG